MRLVPTKPSGLTAIRGIAHLSAETSLATHPGSTVKDRPHASAGALELGAEAGGQAGEHALHVGGAMGHVVEEEVVALDLLEAEAGRGEAAPTLDVPLVRGRLGVRVGSRFGLGLGPSP